MSTHICKITKKRAETPSAFSLFLKPDQTISFEPGQFITLVLDIDGSTVKRSYSLSNQPGEDLRLTIKRVEGGLVSNHLADMLNEGDSIEIEGPEGIFTMTDHDEPDAPRIFIGGGSGITPLYSMLRSSLKSSNAPHHLFYGNTAEEEVIFRNDLNKLEKDFPQLTVHHFYSRVGLMKRLFKRGDYRTGRINIDKIEDGLIEVPEWTTSSYFYICGPQKMNDQMKFSLIQRGVPEDRIRVEFYTSGVDTDSIDGPGQVHMEVHLNHEKINLEIVETKTILNALMDAGYDPPHSCTSGACCTCIAMLEEGEVKMDRTDALSKSEIKKGFILTCQAIPLTEKVKVDYDFNG
jgi:ring-1,2-phenylacetyl-CoA epoxidase subunit PaaE